MPEIRTVEVKAQEVRRNDELQLAMVNSVDVKDKYVYITRVDAPQMRVAKGETLTVRRSFQTDEERAAERKAYQVKSIEQWLASAEAGVDAVWEKIAEHREKGYGLDRSLMESMVIAQQQAHRAAQVRQMMANAEAKGLEGVDLTTCVQHLINEAATRLIENYDAPTYSGGFSFSNAERQSAQDAARKFIQEFRYTGIFPTLGREDF